MPDQGHFTPENSSVSIVQKDWVGSRTGRDGGGKENISFLHWVSSSEASSL
jgi:hypothetical protein